MKNVLDFIKATVLGGIVVIIPLSIILLALGSLMGSLITFGESLGDILPFSWLGNTAIVAAIAALSILIACFVTGLVLLTGPGRRLSAFMQKNLVERIPMLGMLQSLTARFAGLNTSELQPVLVDIQNTGADSMGFLVEELPDNRLAVFVPAVPVATVGQIYFVPRERVVYINASMMDVVNAITQWGVGSKLLFQEAETDKPDGAESQGSR